MADQITLDTILKITQVDTGTLESQLDKLFGASSNSFKTNPFTKLANDAKDALNVMARTDAILKDLGVTAGKSNQGLSNLFKTLGGQNVIQGGGFLQTLDKLQTALADGRIGLTRYEAAVTALRKRVDDAAPGKMNEAILFSFDTRRAEGELAQIRRVVSNLETEADKLEKAQQKLSAAKASVSSSNSTSSVGPGITADIEARTSIQASRNFSASLRQEQERQAHEEREAEKRNLALAAKAQQEYERKKTEETRRIRDETARQVAADDKQRAARQLAAIKREGIAEEKERKAVKATSQKVIEGADLSIVRANTEEANAKQHLLQVEKELLAIQQKSLGVNADRARVNLAASQTTNQAAEALNRVRQATPENLIRRRDEIVAQQFGTKELEPAFLKKAQGQALRQAVGEIADVSKIKVDLSKARSEFDSLSRSIGHAETSVNNFGIAAGLAIRRFLAFQVGAQILYAITGTLRAGFEEALKFEQQMTKIQQVIGTTDVATSQLAASLRKFAVASGTTPNELAEGIKTLAQAGFQNADDLEKTASKLAKIPLAPTFDTIGKTTEGLLAIFGQFNLTLSDTGNILDLVNQFSADFAVESQDIFGAVSKAGASFAIAGGDLKEFIQLFSVLRGATRESAESLGTFFKSGLNQLFRPSSQNLLKTLGVDTNQSILLQLRQLSTTLVGPQSQLSNLQKIDIGRRLLDDSRQFPRFLALLRELGNDNTFARLEASASKAFGSFDNSTVQRIDDVGTSLGRLKETLQDTLNSLVDDQGFKTLIKSIADLTAAVSPLLQLLAKISPLLLSIAAVKFGPNVAGLIREAGTTLINGVGRGRSRLASGRGGIDLDDFTAPQLFEPLTSAEHRAIKRRAIPTLANRIRGGFAGFEETLANPNFIGRSTQIGLGGAAVGGFALAQFAGNTQIAGGLTGEQIGNSVSTGATLGLLTSAIHPAVGAFVALTSTTLSLNEEFKKNQERGQSNTVKRLIDEATGQLGNTDFELSAVAKLQAVGQDTNGILPTMKEISNFFSGIKNPSSTEQVTNNLGADNIQGQNAGAIGKIIIDSIKTRLPGLDFNTLRSNTVERFESIGLRKNEAFAQVEALFKALKITPESVEKENQKRLNAFDSDFKDVVAQFRNLLTSLATTFSQANDTIKEASDQLGSVLLDLGATAKVRLTTDNAALIRQTFPDSIASQSLDRTDQFVRIINGVFSNPQLRGILAQTAPDKEKESAQDILSAMFAGAPDIADGLKREFSDVINILAEESGKTQGAIIGELAKNSGPLTDFIDGLTAGSKALKESTANYIRTLTERFNKELEVRTQLNQRLLGLEDKLASTQAESLGIQRGGRGRSLAQNQFLNFDQSSLSRLREQAAASLAESGQSRFGGQGSFGSRLDTAGNNLLNALKREQEVNIAGVDINTTPKKIFTDVIDAQADYARVQRELTQRSTELQERLSKAAEASDILKQSVTEFRESLRGAGQAIVNYTQKDFANAIVIFKKFLIGSGGGKDVGAGLNSLNSKEFGKLTQLLSTLGSLPLGNGLSGSNLLGNINQTLGTSAIAKVRSQLNGTSFDSEQKKVTQELNQLVAEQKAANDAEVSLRKQQVDLLKLNADSIAKEITFFQSQSSVLTDLVKGFVNSDKMSTIADAVTRIKEILDPNKPLPNSPPGTTTGSGGRVYDAPPGFNGDTSKLLPNVKTRSTIIPSSEPFQLPQGPIDFSTFKPAPSIFNPLDPNSQGPLGPRRSVIPGPLGFVSQALAASAMGALNSSKVSMVDGTDKVQNRENRDKAAILAKIFAKVQANPDEFKRLSGFRQKELLDAYPNANLPGQTKQDATGNTKDTATAVLAATEKQTNSFSEMSKQFTALYDTTVGIKSLLEKLDGQKTTFELTVSPIQVNVALTAPDILKLAGESLASAVINKLAPAISAAFGVVSDEAKSVFESGVGKTKTPAVEE